MERETQADDLRHDARRSGSRHRRHQERCGETAGGILIQLTHVAKSFGTTVAVDEVSLELRPGEIVGLVGENGAGKTTLMRIAAGELAADGGTVVVDGGIALVHQHFLLVNELTIAENLALTATRFRYATRTKLGTEAAATIAATGIDLGNVSRRVEELSVGEKAKLELIKAIARNPATLILDEPTSVLTPTESEELFRVMRELAAKGTAVVFISHKLREVLAVADRIVVMRQGGLVAETLASETTAEELASIMVPAGMTDSRPAARDALPRAETPSFQFEDLAVHAGEIVAIVGVAGNGQTELAAALRAQMPDCGHIPEDRTRDGIIAEMTIAENLALKTKRWKRRDAMRHAEQMIALYSIRANGPRQRAGDLSGGNQQKVILARELAPHPRVIVAAEPTRGLDLEATRFVHTQLRNAAGAHAAIVLITSDLDEAFALADTMHVIYRGRLSERMSPQQASTRVANLMAGVA